MALLSLVALYLPTVAAAQRNNAPKETLTLEQAVTIALENNYQVRVAALEPAKVDEQIAALRTKRLPKSDFYLFGSQLLTEVSFTVRQGQFGTFPSSVGPVPSEDTKITTPRRPNAYVIGQVTQPLSQIYKINLGVKLQEISRNAYQQQLRQKQQEVINKVRLAYYAILQSESALAASEEALVQLRELDRVTNEFVVQQVALKSDGLDVKARLAKEEYTALTLRNSLATQKEYLNQLLARDIRTPVRVQPVPEASSLETNLDAAQSQALSQRPEVKQSRLKVLQAETDRRIKKAEYIPDVSLSFHYLSPFRIEFVPKNITSLGIVFNWEPWDWGRKKHELGEKDRVIEQARNALLETETQVLVDVSQKFRKLQEARALLPVVELAQQAAREKLRVTKDRYAQKAALIKDVLQAQANLAEAGDQYQQALLGFWSAKAEFEKALGEDR